MGWFSDHFGGKYVYQKGVTFQKMKGPMFSEYDSAKKQIKMLTVGNIPMYNDEHWKFKHGYRVHVNRQIFEEVNAMPRSLNIKNLDFSSIIDYITNTLNIADFGAVDSVEDKVKLCNGSLFENDPPIKDLAFETHQLGSGYDFQHFDSDLGWHYWSKHDDGDDDKRVYNNDATQDGGYYKRLYFTSLTLSSDKRTLDIDFEWHKYEDNNGTLDTVVYGQDSETNDVARFHYASVIYVDTNGDIDLDDKLYVERSYYTDAIYSVSSDAPYSFAPLYQVKADNATNEEKRKQKKFLRKLGLSIDSIENSLSNDQIDDYRIGFAIAPDDAYKSSAIAKYLYGFFETISDGTHYVDDNIGSQRNIRFTFNVGGLNVQQDFFLKEDIIAEPMIPSGLSQFGEWKVKLRQTSSNYSRQSGQVNDVYNDNVGGSLTDPYEQYAYIENLHLQDPANEDYSEWFNALPPSDFGKTRLATKFAYCFCHEDDIAEKINYQMLENISTDPDEKDFQQVWEIDSYKRFYVLSSIQEAEYYVTSRDVIYKSVYKSSNATEPATVITSTRPIIEIRKKIDANSYNRFIYSAGLLEYEIDGQTAKIYHKEADSTFRIFMLEDALKDKSFKEFTALYDESLVGVAYSVEKRYMKWYQRNGSRFVIQIVMLVITIWSGGTTSALNVVVNAALAFAIGYVAMKISEYVGGNLGVLLGVIFSMVAFYYTGQLDGMDSTGIWLKASDMYMAMQGEKNIREIAEMSKAMKKFNKEMNLKMIQLRMSMKAMESAGMDRATIIGKIALQMDVDEPDMFNEEVVSVYEENSWKLDEIKAVDYNLADTLYKQTVEIPTEVYEFEHNMQKIEQFGASDEN